MENLYININIPTFVYHKYNNNESNEYNLLNSDLDNEEENKKKDKRE